MTPPELYGQVQWFAGRTAARAEKKVDRRLVERAIDSYLPLLERTRKWSDREKRVPFPLFPGYIFVRFCLTDLFEVLRTPGLVGIVRVNGYPTPVRQSEIDSIHALVDGANRARIEPSPADYLVCGQEVRVLEGPFRGMNGILAEVRGKTRVVVQIEAIRQAVSIEIDRRLVLPLDEALENPLLNLETINVR